MENKPTPFLKRVSDIEKSVNQLKPIPGRFNVYKYGNAKIVIDFAHTPDSIDKLLSLIKANATAKIISVVILVLLTCLLRQLSAVRLQE